MILHTQVFDSYLPGCSVKPSLDLILRSAQVVIPLILMIPSSYHYQQQQLQISLMPTYPDAQ